MSELASYMRLDVSAVSRTLSGDRKMQIEEAYAIAEFIDSPVNDVLRHAGIPVDVGNSEPIVLLTASVNERGTVEGLRRPKQLPQAVIGRTRATLRMYSGSNIVAAQIRASTGALAIFDDAIILFRAPDIVEQMSVGALSICRAYGGEQTLCKVERARKTGEARVVCAGGEVRELILDAATPVLAIIP